MANLDAPFGFNPLGKIGGGTASADSAYPALAGYATLISQGDLVIIDEGTGGVQNGAANALHTDATAAIGIFWGSNFDDSNGKPNFKNTRPASQAATCFVYDDPYQVFEIQGDTATAAAVTDLSKTGDMVVAAGTAATGVSNTELDVSTIGSDANLRIVGFSTAVGRNDNTAIHCVYNVLINEHKFK